MRNMWVVIKHEVLTMLTKRSFWVMTILFPAFIIILNVGVQLVARRSIDEASKTNPSSQNGPEAIGLVDQAGLIHSLPASIPSGAVRGLENEEEALQLLSAGEISSYFLIPAEYLETGKILQVGAQFNPLVAVRDKMFQYILIYNLTGDEAVAQRMLNPGASVQSVSVSPQSRPGGEQNTSAIFVTMFIFFLSIMTGSSLMLQSVSREKENRTVEILLVSLNPRQLMFGKVLGLSIVAFIQLSIWLISGLIFLERGRQAIQGLENFSLPPGFVAWGLLYFILGYLLYASLMGAIGALAPTMREGAQFTFVAILPLLLPVWMNNVFLYSPNGALAVILSLFPMTAPTSMMTRMVATDVPVWQIALGLILLALATYFFVILSARFFRADTLLSTAPLNWQRLSEEIKSARAHAGSAG